MQGFVPKIILVSPPEIGKGIKTSPFFGAFYEDAIEESKRFPECYKAVADAKGCIFFTAILCLALGIFNYFNLRNAMFSRYRSAASCAAS